MKNSGGVTEAMICEKAKGEMKLLYTLSICVKSNYCIVFFIYDYNV